MRIKLFALLIGSSLALRADDVPPIVRLTYGTAQKLVWLTEPGFFERMGRDSKEEKIKILKNFSQKLSDLVRKGFDINQPYEEDNSYSALLYATLRSAQGPMLEIIDLLIKAGADVRYESRDGLTPLLCATSCCSPEIIKLLLKAGADVNYTNKDGITPMRALAALNASRACLINHAYYDETRRILENAGSNESFKNAMHFIDNIDKVWMVKRESCAQCGLSQLSAVCELKSKLNSNQGNTGTACPECGSAKQRVVTFQDHW